MGKIILYISIILFFCSCHRNKYKYHIVGKVISQNGLLNAEWFTDTLSFDGDTAFYKNSDSSVVKIYPPFKVYEIKNSNKK